MKTSSRWVRWIRLLMLCAPVLASAQSPADRAQPLNVLVLTLDDMGFGTTGMEGCTVPGVTPHLDNLASEGTLFTHGYVSVPMCGPSRAALLTGRYPHSSGIMGHGKQPPDSWVKPAVKTPPLSSYLHGFGYRTGAILKNFRCGEQTWDVRHGEQGYGMGFDDRNPASFYERTKAFIAEAEAMKKPFFLYANPIDPHDPWPGTSQEKELQAKFNPTKPFPGPERRYTSQEVDVPAILPDIPSVRRSLVPYYESLHRGDACIGSILKALEESGQAANTLVVFMADNGMCVPGAKNTLYPHGTRTPIVFKLPGKIKPGTIDADSIVCAIDIMPTILEACGLPPVEGIEGRSVYDVLTGGKRQAEREYALTSFDYWNDSKADQFFPMRSIINKDFCYIWNGYVQMSGGKKTLPMPWNQVVREGIENSEKLAERIAFMRKRPVEEFYDLSKDPGCWNNLINDKDYRKQIDHFRAVLKKEMHQSNDPQRFAFGKLAD